MVNYICDVKSGDLIQFNYYGGSVYGATRQIKVTTKTSKQIGGIDVLNDNTYKNFQLSKIGNLKVITESKPMKEELKDLEVSFKKHPVWVKTMLPDFNSRHKVKYVWNTKTKKLELPVTKVKVTGEINLDEGTVRIVTDKGTTINFYLSNNYYNGYAEVYINGRNCYTYAKRNLIEAVS